MFWRLVFRSLLYRRASVLLSILSISIGVFALTATEHLRHEAKHSFSRTVSGVDLIVGARGGELNLLLNSVFYTGSPTQNISYKEFLKLKNSPSVAWVIPLSSGDSHKGFRVTGTDQNFFRHFRYGQKRILSFRSGEQFTNDRQVVIGSAVADKLSYNTGDSITISHGVGHHSFRHHDQHPFTVSGILSPTGTPVDRGIYISLEGMEAIHSDEVPAHNTHEHEQHNNPESITAIMVGLKSRLQAFTLQRNINQIKSEPMMAILPGVALTRLWENINIAENILKVISWLILVASLAGLSATLLASMRERQQELLILRSLGARPWFVFSLIQAETLQIITISISLALASLFVVLSAGQFLIQQYAGVSISTDFMSLNVLMTLLLIVFAGVVVSVYPAYRAYRYFLTQI